MRRSRWDQKPTDNSNLIKVDANSSSASSNWRMDWDNHSSSSADTRHFPNSPAPLDYSRENRARAQSFVNPNGGKKDCNKPETLSGARSNSHIDNSWGYLQNPPYYPEIGHGSQQSYPSHSAWNHFSQNFYSNSLNQHIFDYKWYSQQREAMGEYVDIDNRHHKKDKNAPHPLVQWSYGMRVPRENERYSSFMRNGDSSSMHYNRNYRDHRPFSQIGNSVKYNRFDKFRQDGRQRSLSSLQFNKEPLIKSQGTHRFQNPFFSHAWSSSSSGQSFSHWNSKDKKSSKGNNKSKSTNKKPLSDVEKKIKKQSSVESAKKKALAAAADKLKKTFLAAKKTKKKGGVKKDKHMDKPNDEKEAVSEQSTDAQDLTLPKSIPRDGTSLEYDIDIRFSAREWEFVGRGEGGTRNIPDNQPSSKPMPDCERDSDSESIQTIEDVDSESDQTDSSCDVEEISEWCVKPSIPYARRRHTSETCLPRSKDKFSNHDESPCSKSKRVRSYSTSQMESTRPSTSSKKIGSNLKNVLLKELLAMDKKSLQELVNDPKSRKARLMMGHLMTMHKAALSQKLNHLRFKALPSSTSSDEDIQFWQSITHAQLETLPTDVLDQVRDILTLEQSGKDQQVLDEVSLSISDIFNGFDPVEQSLFNKETASVAEANLELEQLCLQENSPDSECQIVTPPPKRPATTITIPDSDSELLVDNQPSELEFERQKGNPTQEIPNSHIIQEESHNDKVLDSSILDPNPTISANIPDRLSEPLQDFQPTESSFAPPQAVSIQNKVSIASSSRLKSQPSPVPKLGNVLLMERPKSRIEDQAAQHECELNNLPSSVKVKQERPSPMSECGFCMHAARSSHTPHCSFSYAIPPSPVPMMHGPPRPLGHSHQCPVPHLPSELNLFKHEKHAPFVSLDVNRPSSEERPKNPAPPDTNNSEPPSPLPMIPPQTPLHQHPSLHAQQPPPRSLLFSPQAEFSEPPRPPPPPPPQPPHSPRIKFERSTPQYVCCCMRNECERASSHQSADFLRGDTRRNSLTPQNQLCEVAQRITPQLFKMEQHFLSTRARTPHHNVMNMFLPPSPRCIPPNNLPVSDMNSHLESARGVPPKVNNIAIQTEKSPVINREPAPPKSLSSIPGDDKTTSTEDLFPRIFSPLAHCSAFSQRNASSPMSDPLESKINNVLKSVSQLNTDKDNTLTHQLSVLGNQEQEVFNCIEALDKKITALTSDKVKLFDTLKSIHLIRSEKLNSTSNTNTWVNSNSSTNYSISDNAINTEDCSNSLLTKAMASHNWGKEEKELSSSACLPENLSIVSSTQEIASETNNSLELLTTNDSSNDGNALERERCTSTSIVDCEKSKKENAQARSYEGHVAAFLNTESDTDGDVRPSSVFFPKKKTGTHFNNNYDSRRRTDSLSTSDDETAKIKNEYDSCTKFKNNYEIKNYIETTHSSQNKAQESSLNDLEVNICQGRSESNDEEILTSAPITCRKASLSLSPLSPKTRNSSGSEHGYSLRSRGPPSETFDNEGQFLKESNSSLIENPIELLEEKPSVPSKIEKISLDENQADDELDRDDVVLESSTTSLDSKICSEDKRKRKRKSKKHRGRRKRKKESLDDTFELDSHEKTIDLTEEIGDTQSETDLDISFPSTFISPPSHKDSVLELKVIGKYILTGCLDGTARLYDPSTGLICASYNGHLDSVTSIQAIGNLNFESNSDSSFKVITGSEDGALRVFDGKTGFISQKKMVGEPVRCLAHRWGFLFIGTDGGCGAKWNLKDKKIGEKIQFSGKGITCLIPHVEGGRKVLVVASKTTPIMVRDAISGLFLRTLEYVQLNVYTAVFGGNILYTAGSEKDIIHYDICSGQVKRRVNLGVSVCQLHLWKNYLFAICYDGYIRIYQVPESELLHQLPIDSPCKIICSSALYKNKILLGNKLGEILTCKMPDLCSSTND